MQLHLNYPFALGIKEGDAVALACFLSALLPKWKDKKGRGRHVLPVLGDRTAHKQRTLGLAAVLSPGAGSKKEKGAAEVRPVGTGDACHLV